MKFAHGWSAWVLERRASLLVGIALLSFAATLPLDSLRFQSSIEIWFLEDDPDLLVHREFLERFHSNEVALLAVFATMICLICYLTRVMRTHANESRTTY